MNNDAQKMLAARKEELEQEIEQAEKEQDWEKLADCVRRLRLLPALNRYVGGE